MKADLTAQKEKYTAKATHGYYERKINSNTQIDKHLSNYWKKDKFVMPQHKDYLSTIQDQEISTKYLRYKRAARENPLIAVINVDCALPMLKI